IIRRAIPKLHSMLRPSWLGCGHEAMLVRFESSDRQFEAGGASRRMSGESYEQLRANLSATLISLPADLVADHVAGGLGRIANCFCLDYATLYELSDTRTELMATVWPESETSPPLTLASA